MQDEFLDSPNVPARLLLQNLRELDFMNRQTGGHAISLEGLKSLLKDKNKTYNITDLGCGSGDWLRYTAEWARKNGFKVKLTGIDKSEVAIQYLKSMNGNFPEIEGVAGDYRDYMNHSPVDVFHCSLFCHHLDDDELLELLGRMIKLAAAGFVINDLQRSRMAYYGAKAFTTLFRGSYLSKHDGPVSVLRGFKKKELEILLKQTGVNDYRILSRPFFRFLIIARNSADTVPENIKRIFT